MVAGIEAHGIARLWPDHNGRAWIRHQPGPGPEGLYLQKINGHCVFLQEDASCAVHAQMGAAAKPSFCREYPFALVREPRGIAVTVRESCGGYVESAQDGVPLEEQAAEVFALPRPYPMQVFGMQPVALMPGLGVSAEDWLALEERFVADVLANDRTPMAHIAAIRGVMLRAVRRDVPAPDPRRLTEATGALLQVYRMVLDHAVQDPSADAAEVAFADRLRVRVLRAMTRLPDGLPVLDAEARSYVGLLLRGDLLGKRFVHHGSVAVGLGIFLHNILTAMLAAERDEDGVVTASALSEVLTDHVRLTLNRTVLEIQKKARPAVLDVFLSAG